MRWGVMIGAGLWPLVSLAAPEACNGQADGSYSGACLRAASEEAYLAGTEDGYRNGYARACADMAGQVTDAGCRSRLYDAIGEVSRGLGESRTYQMPPKDRLPAGPTWAPGLEMSPGTFSQ
ncbi:hypothetical protein [Salipiger sp.]|uniref:hypothetical protein n=1 Tax=Salipiger sp. TaxID=2078585 RepID=UPI003A97F99C